MAERLRTIAFRMTAASLAMLMISIWFCGGIRHAPTAFTASLWWASAVPYTVLTLWKLWGEKEPVHMAMVRTVGSYVLAAIILGVFVWGMLVGLSQPY